MQPAYVETMFNIRTPLSIVLYIYCLLFTSAQHTKTVHINQYHSTPPQRKIKPCLNMYSVFHAHKCIISFERKGKLMGLSHNTKYSLVTSSNKYFCLV